MIDKHLRRSVIKYVKSGKSYSETARKFKVSCASVKRWYDRYKETGSYRAIGYKGRKPRLSKEEFTAYVNLHPNMTLSQIGSYFGMSAKSACYYMKKCDFTYIKKRPSQWVQRKKVLK